MKSYLEIEQDFSTAKFNVLELHYKTDSSSSSTLTYDDFSEFVLGHLLINPDDCLSYTFAEYGLDAKEIRFKPDFDISPFIGVRSFKGNTIVTKRQGCRRVRLTFRNVPHSVPHQELLHIAETFGTVVDSVLHYEPAGGRLGGLLNLNSCHLQVELGDRTMPNFFWLEGPGQGEAARVTVTFPGQAPQCYNCLKSGPACPGGGRGKACKGLKTERANKGAYMAGLKNQFGYVTLKERHAIDYPSLGGAASQAGGRRPGEPAADTPSAEEEQVILITALQERIRLVEEREREVEGRGRENGELREHLAEMEAKHEAEKAGQEELAARLAEKDEVIRRAAEDRETEKARDAESAIRSRANDDKLRKEEQSKIEALLAQVGQLQAKLAESEAAGPGPAPLSKRAPELSLDEKPRRKLARHNAVSGLNVDTSGSMDETWAEETERLDSGGLDGPPDGEDERLVVGEDLLTPERLPPSAASASSSASPRLQPPPALQLGVGVELASPAPSTEPGS
jgi:hypothetical protein